MLSFESQGSGSPVQILLDYLEGGRRACVHILVLGGKNILSLSMLQDSIGFCRRENQDYIRPILPSGK